MPALLGQQIGEKLIDALGLPKKTVWLELRVAFGEAVSVTCGYYPDDLSADALAEAVSEYELHLKPIPCIECGADGLRTIDGLCDCCRAMADIEATSLRHKRVAGLEQPPETSDDRILRRALSVSPGLSAG